MNAEILINSTAITLSFGTFLWGIYTWYRGRPRDGAETKKLHMEAVNIMTSTATELLAEMRNQLQNIKIEQQNTLAMLDRVELEKTALCQRVNILESQIEENTSNYQKILERLTQVEKERNDLQQRLVLLESENISLSTKISQLEAENHSLRVDKLSL